MDVTYLRADVSIVCWEGWHVYAALAASITVVVFGLGAPCLGFVLLYRSRHKLTETATKQRLFFLYGSYRDDHYYWESVILLRVRCSLAFARLSSENSHNRVWPLRKWPSLRCLCCWWSLRTKLCAH